MNPVILVSSCLKDVQAGHNQVIRDTWGKNSPIPVFFILGEGNQASADEIVLPVKDDYNSLPWKTQQGHKWAREQGYDFIFQCFTDTYVDVDRLLASGFEKGDYVGNRGQWPLTSKIHPGLEFCHGGPGYWLSPKASDLIVAADIGPETLEDQFVASVMKANRIQITDDKRYSMGMTYNFREAVPMPNNQQISWHLSDSGHKYAGPMMFDAERKRVTSKRKPVKILIAISTCRKGLRSNEAIRETWGKTLPDGWDLRFFIGGKYFTDEEWKNLNTNEFIGSPGTLGRMDPTKMSKVPLDLSALQPDEIVLPDVDDGYLGLPWKTTESLRWAMERNYDYVIRGFEDTYLIPERIAEEDWTGIDAAGWDFGCGPCPAHPDESHMNCPLGGAGYITSRRAMEAILDPSNCSLSPLYASHWGEDTMVGWALTKAGIKLFNDERWKWDFAVPYGWNKTKFSIHLCDRGRKYDPAEMYEAHRNVMNGVNQYPGWDGTCQNLLKDGRQCGHKRFRFGLNGPKCRHCGGNALHRNLNPVRSASR